MATMKENIKSLSDKRVRNFVFLQVFYNGMVTILTLFINTFLLKSYGNTSVQVILYNLIQALVMPVAMLSSFWLSRRKSYLFTQRVGFVFYAIALLVLCVWGERAAFLYPLFSVLISFGAGYYYAIYSVETLAYTVDENRDLVQGVTTMICSIIALVLPLLAGYITSVCGDFLGYRIVFGIEAVLAFLALFFTTRLAPIGRDEQRVSFLTVFRTVLRDKNGRRIMVANCLDNCRSSTIVFYVTVLIYRFIENEFLVGLNSSIGSILAILGAAFYGVLVNKRNRLHSVALSVVLVLGTCVVMCFSFNVYALMVFYAAFNLTTIYMGTPVLNLHFLVMEQFDQFRGMGAQLHAVREVFVTIGRVIGILMILLLPQTTVGIVLTLSLIMTLPLVNILLMRRIEKT